jgi:hypothetical protein
MKSLKFCVLMILLGGINVFFASTDPYIEFMASHKKPLFNERMHNYRKNLAFTRYLESNHPALINTKKCTLGDLLVLEQEFHGNNFEEFIGFDRVVNGEFNSYDNFLKTFCVCQVFQGSEELKNSLEKNGYVRAADTRANDRAYRYSPRHIAAQAAQCDPENEELKRNLMLIESHSRNLNELERKISEKRGVACKLESADRAHLINLLIVKEA